MNVFEKFHIAFEEFLGDGLDTKGLLNIRKFGIGFRVLEQGEKSCLRRMATLAFSHDVREAACRGEPGLHADPSASLRTGFAGFLFHGSVFHLDIGKAPLFFRRRHKGNKGCVLFIACFEVMCDKITDGGARPCQLGFIGQMNNQNIQFIIIGCSVGAEPFVAVDMVFEGGLNIRAVPRLGL